MPRKRKRLGGGSDEGKGGGNSSRKTGETDMTSDTVDKELCVKDLDVDGVSEERHGGGADAYSSSTAIEGFINGLKSCGNSLLMGEERVKESTMKLLMYLCEFVEGEKAEETSGSVLKALPGLLAWAKEVCLFVRGGGGGCGASTKGGVMSGDSPKNHSSPRSHRSPSSSPRPLKEENIRYLGEDDTKYRDNVLNAALRFATACLELMIMDPEQPARKEDSGYSEIVVAPSSSSLHAWGGLQAVVVVEAAAGIAASPPQLNWYLQRVRGGGGGGSTSTTLSSQQIKRQLWDYNELDFWKMPRFKIKDDELHLPDSMVHELQSVAADYFVTAAQHHIPTLRSPRSSLPLTPLVSSLCSPPCGGSGGSGDGGVSKGLHGVLISLRPSSAVGARIMRWACRICEVIQVIAKEEGIPTAETAPVGGSGGGGVAYGRPLLFLSAVRRVLFVVRKGVEAAKHHHEVMPVSQTDGLEVWKLSTGLMDALLTATEDLIQSVEVRGHSTSASSLKSDTILSPTAKSPPSTLLELCMALSHTLNVIERGTAVTIESIVPEALDDIKFLAVSPEASAIRAGEQCAALSVYCAARIIAGLPGKGALADLLKRLGLDASPNKTSRGAGLPSQAQEVKEDKYRPPAIFYGQLLSTALRTFSDLLRVSSQVEKGGGLGMSNVHEDELSDTMSQAGRKCFLVPPSKRLDLFLEEFVNSIRDRGRRRASWCRIGGDSDSCSISHFENDCKDVMTIPRAVADRLILTLVASMASERMARGALPRRGVGFCFGHIFSLPPSGSATLKPWSGGISVVSHIIAILRSLLKAAATTECQSIPPTTGQSKGVEDSEPSSTAHPHTEKRIRLIESVKLTADKRQADGSINPEAMEESEGEGTTPPTYSHPLVANQTNYRQFALLFTAALEEDHFAAISIAWRSCDPWNLHETPRLSLGPSSHQLTSPTSGSFSPPQPSVALSWIRKSWAAWGGLLACLGTCCSKQWVPQMLQFLNGNADAACLVQSLLQELPFRAMAGTLRSSSDSHGAAVTNEEPLNYCISSSASYPFILPIPDIALLRKCLGGVLARPLGDGGSARVEGIFPPEILVAPWDCLLEYCTSGVKKGRGFVGCGVSVLLTQLLISSYFVMEKKERKEVAARAFSACLTLAKELSDLQSTSGDGSSRTVVEFEDVVLKAARPLQSVNDDGLNLVSNYQGQISILLGHILFLLCFACDKLIDGSNEDLQARGGGGGGGGKQDTFTASCLTASLNQLPSLRGLGGNVISGETSTSNRCGTDLINDAVHCLDNEVMKPPCPWGRTGHAGKVCLENVVNVHELRTQLVNTLSSAVIFSQPPLPSHAPDVPIAASNTTSSMTEVNKRCIDGGCFLYFAAWKLLAYLPGEEDLNSLHDSMQNPEMRQQQTIGTCTEEDHPETTIPTTMAALRLACYARSALMLLPAPELEFSSLPHEEEGRNDKACSQVGSPHFDGLIRVLPAIDLREISDKFQERLQWLVAGAQLEGFPSGVFRNGEEGVGLMEGCKETSGDQENEDELEDANQTTIDSLSSLNPANVGSKQNIYIQTHQNWEEEWPWEQKYHKWIRVKDGEGRENDVNAPVTPVSHRRVVHASLQAVSVYLEAACASAQSEVLELNEAGLLFSSERTDSVFKALSHWTSLFEKCLEHFLFILKGGLMELRMIGKDWYSQKDVDAADEAVEILMLVEWPDIKEAAILLGLPIENLEVLRDTITATPLPRVQLGSDFQRNISLRTVSSSAHSSPSLTACMEPERVALARGSASCCMWEYILNVSIATTLFPAAGTTPTTHSTSTSTISKQNKSQKENLTPMSYDGSSSIFPAILEECTSAKNVLLEVFDGLLALLSLIHAVMGNNSKKPNALSVDLADAIRLVNESLAHPWLSSLRIGWMNAITEMRGGDDCLSGEMADAWKIHSAGRVLSSVLQQPTGWGRNEAKKAGLYSITLLRTLVRNKGPRIVQEYYLSGIETPEGISRRPQQWEYELLDMFAVETSDAVPSFVPNPDVCDLLRFIAAVPECSNEVLGLLKNLVCVDKEGLEKKEEWAYEWPMLITPLVNLLVSWSEEDELKRMIAAQLDHIQTPPLLQQDKQPSPLQSQLQCEKSSQAKDFVDVLCSLLGRRGSSNGLVNDGIGERIERDVEDSSCAAAHPSLLGLTQKEGDEEEEDSTGGDAALLVYDDESQKNDGGGRRAVAFACTSLSSEEIRPWHKRRRSVVPGHQLRHNVSLRRPIRISRKPLRRKDKGNDKGGGGLEMKQRNGSYVIPGRNELRHCVLDVLIQLAHSWIPSYEIHYSGISDLAVWLASQCDKLPRLLFVTVEVGLKIANNEHTGFSREQQQQQPLESATPPYSFGAHHLRSILQCLSLAKHLLNPLSRLKKMTTKQLGPDQDALKLRVTLDDLELVPQSYRCSDEMTETFAARNRGTAEGMVTSESSKDAARHDEEAPIVKSEQKKRTCTYVESSGDFVEQHWYNCFTCGLIDEKGCCSVCVKVCHAGHSVSYSRFSSYFCDCGAGEGLRAESSRGGSSMSSHPCKCLNPFIPEVQTEMKDQLSLAASSALCHVTAMETDENVEPAVIGGLDEEMSSNGGSGVTPQCGQQLGDLQGRQNLKQQNDVVLLPAVWSKASQHTLFEDLQWLKDICSLLRELLTLVFGEIRREVQTAGDTTTITPYLTPNIHPLWMNVLTLSGSHHSIDVEGSSPLQHQQPSICKGIKKQLLSSFWRAKQGTFNVTSHTASSQQLQNLSIMPGHIIVKRCIAADSRGRVAIAENKQVLIVDPTNFLMGPEGEGEGEGKGQTSLSHSSSTESLSISAMADRSHIGTLSSTGVGFDVIGLVFNPENEQHLAVWGLSRVVVLTGQHKSSILGEPRSQLRIDLSFGMGEASSTSILKVMWIPNSQVLLVVVCMQFVRVYDLSRDVRTPIHTLFLPATSSEGKESSTFICDAVLLPPAPLFTSLHPSFVVATGKTCHDDGCHSPTATSSSTPSDLAATVLILTNHGQLFSKGIPKLTQTILEDGFAWRRSPAFSPSPHSHQSSPKIGSNQDFEIRHEVVIPSHLHYGVDRSNHSPRGVSLHYSVPTGVVLYCTDSIVVLALAVSGAGDECEVVGGLSFNPIPGGRSGQDGSGSEDSMSQMKSSSKRQSESHKQPPPPQYIGWMDASSSHSLFNSKTSVGWNNNWNTKLGATTTTPVGSWSREKIVNGGVVDDRSTLLLCMVTRGSNSNSSHGYGLAIRLRAKKDKGGGVEIATQTLPWGSPQRMGIRAAKPSVNSSSSGELFLKGPTFSSSGDTRARGGVQGMCVCPAFHGMNFAADCAMSGKGSSVPLKYPSSVLVLYETGGLQCFRMVTGKRCKKQQSVEPLLPLNNGLPIKSTPPLRIASGTCSSLSHNIQCLESKSNVEGERKAQQGQGDPLQAKSSDASWPVDIFEHLHRVTTDPRLYLGGDMVGEYTPEQILSKLRSRVDDYVMMPRLCGGSVSIHLKHPHMQIVAVRVHAGTTSSEHRPQFLRVMGKTVPIIADSRQWYDFILSDEDMLHCEYMKALTVSVSSTKESGDRPAITGLEVYATGRPTPPSHIPVMAKTSPEMGSEGQVELIGVEAAAASPVLVPGSQCKGTKVDYVQSTLEACMEVAVDMVSIVSARSVAPERRLDMEGRGNGNKGDKEAQSSSSSLSELQNLALYTLSHTVLLSDVSRWMAVRKLCRSIIFYINNESSKQISESSRAWENTTSLGMIDTAQLEAIHCVLLSPQLPMRQLRQCLRFCALVCRDRPEHRNPAIDSALCVSAFFRARWHCGGWSTSELAGVVHDLIRCVCLDAECRRRLDKDKRKGEEMVALNDVEGHSTTPTISFPSQFISGPTFAMSEVGSDNEHQKSILSDVVDQLLLLLCGPSAHLSCIAAKQLVGVLTPHTGLLKLKTAKTLAPTQMGPPSRSKAMQQCRIIRKDHNSNCNNWEEEFVVLGRETSARKSLPSACSDSDGSEASGNDVMAATGDEKFDDVVELEDVTHSVGVSVGVGSRQALSFVEEDLDGIATNSEMANDDRGTDNNNNNNEEGHQRLDYRCDRCNHFPLEGIRHHCTECDDFDLCHTCFARIHVLGTSLPPPDSDHNVLHRVIAQVIYPPPSTTPKSCAVVSQQGHEHSDAMEVDELDDSIATPPVVITAAVASQGVILTSTGNTNRESDETTTTTTAPLLSTTSNTQPLMKQSQQYQTCLPQREEESASLEWRLLHSLSELLFAFFVDRLPALISIRRTGHYKHDSASYMCFLVKLSEGLPSTCTEKLIDMLQKELIRISSDLTRVRNGSNNNSLDLSASQRLFNVDSDAFCILAKTVSYLCNLRKGERSNNSARINESMDDHKVTYGGGGGNVEPHVSLPQQEEKKKTHDHQQQQGQQHITTASMWNDEGRKLSLQLCELLGSILGTEDSEMGLGRVPTSGYNGTSSTCYGRDGTPMLSPSVNSSTKVETNSTSSQSVSGGRKDELLIPISRYSLLSYGDQSSTSSNKNDNNSMLSPYTCDMSHHRTRSSHLSLSDLYGGGVIGGNGRIGATDSNNKNNNGRNSSNGRRSGRNVVPDFSMCTSLPKCSQHMGIVPSLLKLGHTLATISKQQCCLSRGRGEKQHKWWKEWILHLCKIIGSRELRLLHRSAKGLLCEFFGQILYHRLRDQYLFATEVKQVLDALSPVQHHSSHPPGSLLTHEKRSENVKYSLQVAAKMSLDVLLKAAAARPRHWHRFCCLPKIPLLDDSWPLELSSSNHGQYVANELAIVDNIVTREGGGEVSHHHMANDENGGGKDPIQPPVCALLSLLWLPSVPSSLKVGILDLLEKATSSLPSVLPIASSSVPKGETTTTTQSAVGPPVKGKGGHEPKKVSSVQASESLPALFLLTNEPNPPHMLLIRIAKELVLSSPYKGIKQRAANLVFYLWRTSPESCQGKVVRAMAKDIPESILFGMRSREWLQLMRNITSLLPVGKTEHLQVVDELARALYEALLVCNYSIVNHPNASIYETTEALLNTTDCYLDQLPCQNCPGFTRMTEKGKISSNSDGWTETPQIQGGGKNKEGASIRCEGGGGRVNLQKGEKLPTPMESLDEISDSSRTLESAVIVKLSGSYCIEKLGVTVSDARGRLVKAINVYHHAPAVSSIKDLRLPENAHKWERCAILCLGPDEISATVELPLPLETRALMFEFASFHEDEKPQGGGRDGSRCKEAVAIVGGDLGWVTILCPQCSCIVVDPHGVCPQCGDVAFQCKQCRHINYEHLNAFLCVECGYCAYGTFNWRVAAKSVISLTHISSESDRINANHALVASDVKARGHQQSIMSLQAEIQQLVMTIGKMGGNGSGDTGTAMVPFYTEHEELIRDMMKDLKNTTVTITTTTTTTGPSCAGSATNLALTPFLRSLFVGVFPDDLDGDSVADTVDSDRAAEDMLIDEDEDEDEDDDDEAEVEGEMGGSGHGNTSRIAAGGNSDPGEAGDDQGRDRAGKTERGGGGSEAQRTGRLIGEENRQGGGVTTEAGDHCEAIDALDHILSLSLSQNRPLGNRGGGEIGLSFEDCIHISRNNHSSPGFARAAVSAMTRRGDNNGSPHPHWPLPTYRSSDGRVSTRNRRVGNGGGSLAASGRSKGSEKRGSDSAVNAAARNQDHRTQNSSASGNNAGPSSQSSSLQSSNDRVSPAVERLLELYCRAGRHEAIHLHESYEFVYAWRNALRYYELRSPPQPYRQRHYLENVHEKPFPSITDIGYNSGGTCYKCSREVMIELLLTLSSLYLRGYEGRGTMLEDLLMSLLNDGIQVGSASCKAAGRQCVISILKGSPKRACDIVLNHLEGRFNLALTYFTGQDLRSCLGDDWLLFRDLLLGPKSLVGHQELQRQQQEFKEGSSSGIEVEDSRAGKGGSKKKAKGNLLQAVTNASVGAGAAFLESFVASELSVPFLFSIQHTTQLNLNVAWERLISILFSSMTRVTEGASKAMITHVALPTLSILAKVCLAEESGEGDGYASRRLLREALSASLDAVWVIEGTCWKSSGYTSSPLWITTSQARRCNLAKKYCLRWLSRVGWLGRSEKSSAFFNQYPMASCDVDQCSSYLKHASLLPKHFIWSMLVTPHSAQARTLSGLLLLRLAQGSPDHINMLESVMHVLSVMPLMGAEKEALPCLGLASALWQTPLCTAYMAARGLIPVMCRLLLREADWLQKQEVEWAYLSPIGGSPVCSQSYGRSGDLALRCSEALVTYCSSCSSYGFWWAPQNPSKLLDVALIFQVVIKLEGLELSRTLASKRAAFVLRRLTNFQLDPEIHVRAGIRVLQQCASVSPSSAEWNSEHYYPQFTLSISMVHDLLVEIGGTVSPPIEMPCFPVLMRREPSHDVYFRGSLYSNPFLSSEVTTLQDIEAGPCRDPLMGGGWDGLPVVTMDDIRHKIARELDMTDAAELLELLVCNCIISPTVPLRLVFEKLWRPHVLENHDDDEDYNSDGEPEDLHPMTITYRLGGVDGEATEDKVDSLDDDANEVVEAEMARRKALVSAIGEEGGLPLLLGLLKLRSRPERNVQGSLAADTSSTNGGIGVGDGADKSYYSVQDMVVHADSRDIVARALQLLRHCCDIRANRRRLLRMRAPGILLHHTVDVLRGSGSKQARQSTLDCLLMVIEALAQELSEETSSPSSFATTTSEASINSHGKENDSEGQQKTQPVLPANAVAGPIEFNPTTPSEIQGLDLSTIMADQLRQQSKVEEEDQGSNRLQADQKSETKLGNDNPQSEEAFRGGSHQLIQPNEEETMEDVEGQHIHFLLDALKEKSMIHVLRDSPALVQSVSRLLPFLTYAKPKAIQALADQFGRVVTWEDEEEEAMTEFDKEPLDSTTEIEKIDASEEAKAEKDIRRKCFEEALDTMARDRAGDAVRSKLIDTGFLIQCCHFVLQGLPSPGAPWADWEPYCRRDKLDRALKVLTGLTRAYEPSQAVLFEAGLLTAMQRLERTPASLSGNIGLLAETLLESMSENNPRIASDLSKLRETERASKLAQASAQRDKALLAMRLPGMERVLAHPDGTDVGTRSESLPASGELPAWMEEMKELEEETGLSCMVCHEGYSCSPREILGTYIHARVVGGSNLSQLEGHSLVQQSQKSQFEELLRQSPQHMDQYKRRRMCQRLIEETDIGEPISRALQNAPSSTGGFLHRDGKQKESGSLIISCTSAFNVLHFSCHQQAAHADKNLRNPKSEWEGAALRNSRMSCNSMLPIWSPSPREEPRSSPGIGVGSATASWAHCLDKHFSNVQEVMQSALYSSGGTCVGVSGHRVVPAVGRLCLVLHDIRLLLMQLCYQENLSLTSGGGSLGSNIRLFWYMLQLAGHVCKTGGVEAQKYKMLLPSPEAQESLEEGAAAAEALEIEPSSSQSETLARRAVSSPFRLVLSIVLDDINTWATRKMSLLCDMIRLVGMRYSRGLEGSGAVVKRGTRSSCSMNQVGRGEVGVKRKRKNSGGSGLQSGSTGDGDTADEIPNVETSYLETTKPAMILLALVNKVKSLWPGSADGLLNEDDNSFAELSEAMLQYLQHLTTDIPSNNCEIIIEEAGCRKLIEDSSLSANEWFMQLFKEGMSLATADVDIM